MSKTIAKWTRLTDTEVLSAVAQASSNERTATAHLIGLLAELDARRLYLAEGCSSLFTYCTQVLHLSEYAAYGRIEAARCARRFPVILDMLVEGAITLTTVTLLAPHLAPENIGQVLERARHKTRREIEQIVAHLRPLPSVPSSVRRLPTRQNGVSSTSTKRELPEDKPDAGANGIAEPVTGRSTPQSADRDRRTVRQHPGMTIALAPELYKIQITVSQEAHDKLRRAQDLLRHVIPNGDPAAIVERALTVLVENLERTRLAATTRPRSSRNENVRSRHVPAAIRRQVWARDAEQCAFIGTQGRCTERGFLELHHLVPFAAGGETTLANLELRCRQHNQYEWDEFSGPMLAREAGFAYVTTRFEPS